MNKPLSKLSILFSTALVFSTISTSVTTTASAAATSFESDTASALKIISASAPKKSVWVKESNTNDIAYDVVGGDTDDSSTIVNNDEDSAVNPDVTPNVTSISETAKNNIVNNSQGGYKKAMTFKYDIYNSNGYKATAVIDVATDGWKITKVKSKHFSSAKLTPSSGFFIGTSIVNQGLSLKLSIDGHVYAAKDNPPITQGDHIDYIKFTKTIKFLK